MIVLPRYFKHGNFSSFVRQLNTYPKRRASHFYRDFAGLTLINGSLPMSSFCKEASIYFRTLRERRSTHPQLVASEASGPEMETKLEKLSTEKSVIMQEMAELQQQHRETAEHMETVKKRLQISEQKQKKMVSFVAKAVQNPEFIELVMEMEQRLLDCSPIVKEKTQEQVQSSEMPSSLHQNYVLQERMPFSSENESSDELGATHDIGYFLDFAEELATDEAFTESLWLAPTILSMSNSIGSPISSGI